MGKKSLPTDVESAATHTRKPPPPPPPPPPRPWFAWLVPLIFFANVALFVYSMYANDCPSTREPNGCLFYHFLGRFSFQPFEENPLLGPSTLTLKRLGALEQREVLIEKQYWRLFSCMWLHAGVIHLLTNMFSLLFIGVQLEKEFGFLRIGLLYAIAGFGGSLQSLLHLKPSARATVSVGASGALFGLLGAMLSELIINWSLYANKCVGLLSLLFIIAINLALGFLPRVDNSAHIGGFLSGFLLGIVLLIRPQYGYVSRKYIPAGYNVKCKPKHKCYQYCLLVVALVILILGYAYGLLQLFHGRPSGWNANRNIFLSPIA